jgi:hypothetical protein
LRVLANWLAIQPRDQVLVIMMSFWHVTCDKCGKNIGLVSSFAKKRSPNLQTTSNNVRTN